MPNAVQLDNLGRRRTRYKNIGEWSRSVQLVCNLSDIALYDATYSAASLLHLLTRGRSKAFLQPEQSRDAREAEPPKWKGSGMFT
eukprot:2987718-Amphidinium_carterae.1